MGVMGWVRGVPRPSREIREASLRRPWSKDLKKGAVWISGEGRSRQKEGLVQSPEVEVGLPYSRNRKSSGWMGAGNRWNSGRWHWGVTRGGWGGEEMHARLHPTKSAYPMHIKNISKARGKTRQAAQHKNGQKIWTGPLQRGNGQLEYAKMLCFIRHQRNAN